MLKKIYCAFTTREIRHAGTNSKPVLILGSNDRDIIHETFDLDEPIEAGASNLISFDVQQRNVRSYFRYMRMALRGADAWRPETIFIFGEEPGHRTTSFRPIAIKNFNWEQISTDESEGPISIPLGRANLGGYYTRMNRMMIIIKNSTQRNAGTKSPVLLVVEGDEGELLRYEIPEGKLAEAGGAFVTVQRMERVDSSNDIRSIKLYIGGPDQWEPESMWVLGLDDRPDSYEQVVPFVCIPDWSATGIGKLVEAEGKEGQDSATLYQAYL